MFSPDKAPLSSPQFALYLPNDPNPITSVPTLQRGKAPKFNVVENANIIEEQNDEEDISELNDSTNQDHSEERTAKNQMDSCWNRIHKG